MTKPSEKKRIWRRDGANVQYIEEEKSPLRFENKLVIREKPCAE